MRQDAVRLAKSSTWTAGVRKELRLQAPFMVLVAVFVAVVAAIAHLNGLDGLFRMTLYSEMMRVSALLFIPVALLSYGLYMGLVEKEAFPVRRLALDLRSHILTSRGAIGILIPLLIVPFMVSTFSSFKSMIPLLNPFHWDVTFYQLDKWLHFGVSPWEVTHFLFRDLYSTLTINFLYHLWFFLMWIFMFCHIFSMAGKRARAHYMISFSMCWIIIGSIFAFILSSGGPVYYGRLTGLEDVYAPLMDRLQTMDASIRSDGGFWEIWVLDVQDHLWEQYTSAATTIGSGISAMPSMHVSIATLMALSARRIGRWFGRVMTVYAVIIMIGSVHLGWHYAVDGYLAFILTVIIWKLSDWVIERVQAEPPTFTTLKS